MRLSKRSSGMWLVSAMTAMGAVLCGRFGWCSALAGTLAAYILYNIVGTRILPGPIRAVQALWLAVPLCVAARGAAALFPDAGNGFYVPAVVLALSWLLSRHSREGVASCCTVVGFFVLAAVGIVAVFALPEIELRWLRPEFDWRGALEVMALGAAGFALAEVGEKPAAGWRIAAFAIPAALTVLCAGSLSPVLAARQTSAFYTLSRSISVFGVVERFEALIAACLTLGVCITCTLIFCAARSLVPEKLADGLTAFLALAALFGMEAGKFPVAAAAGTVLLWILLPLAKNLKKRVDKPEK